jgi:hypothetical protein
LSRENKMILSRVQGSVTNNNGFRIGWLGLLTPFTVTLIHNEFTLTHNTSWAQFWSEPRLSSLLVCPLLWLTWFRVALRMTSEWRTTESRIIPHVRLNCVPKSQSHIATDGMWVSKSWCRAPSGAHDQILITVWQLRSCFCGAPSLTRGLVRLLYMLLALASTVFLGSESLETRDLILLSQFWDFLFRRLIRLAGSRWRYSTPPPHGLRTTFLSERLLM